MARLRADPEVNLAQGGAARLQIALLPAIAVHQTLPPLALRLDLATEAPTVLVVNGHNVRSVSRGQPGRVLDDQEVLVVRAAGLGAEVVRAREHYRVGAKWVHHD